MPKLTLEKVPLPFDLSDEAPKTFLDEVAVAANTADFLTNGLNAPLDVDPLVLQAEQRLLRSALANQDAASLTSNLGSAYAAKAFMEAYGKITAFDVGQARSAITAKLMEIANCGETRYELKALELLGKHSDIGLFTERSEITIRHKDADSLEEAIKDRVKRLLAQRDAPLPASIDELDDELGVITAAADGTLGIIDAPQDLDKILGVADAPTDQELEGISAYYRRMENLEEQLKENIAPKPRAKGKAKGTPRV